MFGSLKSLKACTPLISYWLICQETRNVIAVNAPRLSVLGLFDFRKMTYTPRRREYIFTRPFFLRAETWHNLPHGFGVLPGGARIYSS